jgi:hypothetical protein
VFASLYNQVMLNGWRLFLASYMKWPEMKSGHQVSIPELFAIYRPLYSKIGTLAFTVQVNQQFNTIKQIYSNNKHWDKVFFNVSGEWESPSTEVRPEDQRVPRQWGWGIPKKDCKYFTTSSRYIHMHTYFFLLILCTSFYRGAVF